VDEERLALGLSYARLAVGVGAALFPGPVGTLFFGAEESRRPVSRLLGRLFGIRDAALGFLTLRALERADASVDDLLATGLLVDAADMGALLAGARRVPDRATVLGLALAGGFAAVGARLLVARRAID
jgi:hypothetical protein